ncbi:hypothetical protein ACP275_08G101100 [Erythranthe tilingii]
MSPHEEVPIAKWLAVRGWLESSKFKINTCNGFYCDAFSPNKPYKPHYLDRGLEWLVHITRWSKSRATSSGFSVCCSQIYTKGRLVYQLLHGTNFGRSAGGPFITTSYDYDAPLDEFDPTT